MCLVIEFIFMAAMIRRVGICNGYACTGDEKNHAGYHEQDFNKTVEEIRQEEPQSILGANFVEKQM